MGINEADSAILREAFNEAAAEWAKIFMDRTGPLSNWKPTREDILARDIWGKFYEAVSDSAAGLTMLAHVQYLQDSIDRLEGELAAERKKTAGVPLYDRPQRLETR